MKASWSGSPLGFTGRPASPAIGRDELDGGLTSYKLRRIDHCRNTVRRTHYTTHTLHNGRRGSPRCTHAHTYYIHGARYTRTRTQVYTVHTYQRAYELYAHTRLRITHLCTHTVVLYWTHFILPTPHGTRSPLNVRATSSRLNAERFVQFFLKNIYHESWLRSAALRAYECTTNVHYL